MIDLRPLSHATRLSLLAVLQRQRARIDAQEQRLLHVLATGPLPAGYRFPDGSNGPGKDWVREEIACALRIAPAVATGRIATATALVTRLPESLNALGRGDFTRSHAVRLAEAVQPLPDEAAAQVESRVLPRASAQTAAQFGVSVRRAVLALDPRDPDEQHADAIAERRLVFSARDNGMAELWALLPADTAAALKAVIDQVADDAHQPEDERTADQRRADALLDLGLGGRPLRPQVQVTVALSTLLCLDQQPGELAGHGPVPAPLARALAFDPTGT